MPKQKWDLTSTHSLQAAARWIRKDSDALMVVVLRAHDGVISLDETIDPIDAEDRLWMTFPTLLAGLKKALAEGKA